MSYADFLKELAKQKVTLTLSQKSEWEDYFETEKKKVMDKIPNRCYRLRDRSDGVQAVWCDGGGDWDCGEQLV